MVVFGSPETWGMKVDEFIDLKDKQAVPTPSQQLFGIQRLNFAGGETPGIVKLKQILDTLKPGDDFSISGLANQAGLSNRKTVTNILERDYPQLGKGTGTKTQVANLAKRTIEAGETEFNKLLEQGYLEDYKTKIQTTKSTAEDALKNKALAKKYFPDLSEVAGVGRIERANKKIRSMYPELTYAKATPQASYIKREQRKKLYKPSEEEAKILRQQNAQKKILNKYFQRNPEQILKNDRVKQLLDVKLKNGELDFTPRYTKDKDYLKLAKSGKLFDEFDITPIRSEKRNIQYPVNKSISPGKFNQGFIKQVDAYFKNTKGSVDPKVLENKKNISKFLDNFGIRVEVEGERIGSKILPAFDKQTGELPNIKNVLNKLNLSNLNISQYVPPKTKNVTEFLKSQKLYALPIWPLLEGAGTVLGSPAAALAFAGSEFKRGLDEGKTFFEAATAPTVGISLLGPGTVSKLNPGVLKGVLGLGKAARFFTPTGIGLLAAGQAKDFYDQYRNLQRMKETDPQAYEAFVSQRISEEVAPEQQAEIEAMGREGAMGGGIMRIGLKDGPEDPAKRKTLKVGLGILGALPFGVTKIFQKPAVQEAAAKAIPAAQAGWSWVKNNFWDVVATIKDKGSGWAKLKEGEVRILKDMEVVENPETIRVRYKTDNGNSAETVYTKPYKEVNPETGEIIDVPGDFQEYQDVYRLGDGEVYKDFEEEIIDSVDNVKKIIKED